MTTIHTNPENPNRKLVMQALGYTDWGYDNLIHQFFVTWCEEMAIKFYQNNRSLISSEPLYNYYRKQWSILVEARMVSDYGIYLKRKVKASESFYKILNEYATELEQYYPASLIKPMKNQKKPKYDFNYN